MKQKIFALILSLIMIIAVSGCAAPAPTPSSSPSAAPTQTPPAQSTEPTPITNLTLLLSTTTSTQDSGLLDYLLPEFKKDTGIETKVVAVGSGKAIQMGVDGEADVLLVHARAAEDKFIADGDGTERFDVMYNDFVIVGPKEDPAAIKGLATADALSAMSKKEAKFVSRGDDSGTHKKELELWKAANIEPEGNWYISAGKGMGEVLSMANELKAYTLTDRATYLSMKDKLELEIVLEREADLLNPYGILIVNPNKNDNINEEGARAFAEWMTSAKAQALIGEFGVDKYGEPLFIPDAK